MDFDVDYTRRHDKRHRRLVFVFKYDPSLSISSKYCVRDDSWLIL